MTMPMSGRGVWARAGRLAGTAGLALGLSACPPDVQTILLEHQAAQDSIRAVSDSAACATQVPSSIGAAKGALALSDCRQRTRVLRSVSIDMQYVGEQMTTIPEYHDEQRLTTSEGRYGPAAYVFASPSIAGFVHGWQLAEHGSRGALWAIVVVDTAETAVLPSTYTDLGLRPGGRNCIWLSQAGTGLKARVTHQLDRAKPCDPTGSAREMQVLTDPIGTVTTVADQPPVARFSETQNGRPLIGARCLLSWCEFGPPPATSGGPATWAPHPVGLASGYANSASQVRERVKGWNDMQTLATGSGPTLRPNGPKATFVPAVGLADRSQSFYAGSAWHPVGTLYIRGAVVGTQYASWGIRPGANVLALKFEGNAWRMQVSNTAGTKVWTNVHRHEHHDAALPGTARFRWISYDDGFWVPCGQGCCRADGV